MGARLWVWWCVGGHSDGPKTLLGCDYGFGGLVRFFGECSWYSRVEVITCMREVVFAIR